MIILDENDAILKLWQGGTNGSISTLDEISNFPIEDPVAFRGMTKRKIINECKISERDFYYIDTGYLGNLGKRKDYHRVVKNNVQHVRPIPVPTDRFDKLQKLANNTFYKNNWNKKGSNILIVTPSEKPCKFYGITRDKWLSDTVQKLEQHTDRKIIIRDKPIRRERIGNKSIFNQIEHDDIYAVVTYNSIAATEAVSYGIPAFADAPVNAAKSVCSDDFSKIEDPFYPDRYQVDRWLHWLAYCQYNCMELEDGTAFRIQEEYNLC
jgi:hypothetical protein